MGFKRLAIILGDCLFPHHHALRLDEETLIFMREDRDLCTHFRYHKQKLVLFLSAMRSHADELQEHHQVHYERIDETESSHTYEDSLLAVLKDNPQLEGVITYEIEDHFFDQRLRTFCEKNNLTMDIVQSPKFLTSRSDFEDYLSSVSKPFMHTFYQRQRKGMSILLDEAGGPLHGKWSFDEENRKKLPQGLHIPDVLRFEPSPHTRDVKGIIDDLFPTHVGNVDQFAWGTTRRHALEAMADFFDIRFHAFGPYEDAIDSVQPFLFHSTLSPYLNIGLLTPKELVQEALTRSSDPTVPYSSVEGFIRQVIGWREFVRGIYHNYEEELQSNFFQHSRTLKDNWYDGTTGLTPVDDSIKKVLTTGYAHHIERLMVLGNAMLLSEIHPSLVYQWFMEMFVDSADWVMLPNVYGMSQYADGGIFSSKPYIGGANYIIKMSHYRKSEPWVDTFNGLFWRFVQNKRDVLSKNARLNMMARHLDRMSTTTKRHLFKLADEFLDRTTSTD